MADNGDDYEVGYCKPPKHSRWPKGQSGNPGGRSSGASGLKSDLARELAARMEIRMNGKPVRGTTQRLMIKTLAARAGSGDLRATKLLTELILQVFGPEDRGAGAKRLSAGDQKLLDALLGESGDAGAAEGHGPEEGERESGEGARGA